MKVYIASNRELLKVFFIKPIVTIFENFLNTSKKKTITKDFEVTNLKAISEVYNN